MIRWLRGHHPELRVQRINRESSSASDFSALLDSRGWRVREAPRVVWLRQFLPERDPYGPSPTPAEIDDILIGRRQWLAWTHLFSSLGSRWVNSPDLVYRAESKVHQIAVAIRVGFEVPKTLLTNDRDEAKAFSSADGPCIVKSVASAFWEFSDQSFVFTADGQEALAVGAESWKPQPVFVQQRIYGTHEARLLVAGGRICGARRDRTSLDWRTDPRVEWTPWVPDQATAECAAEYMRHVGLDYGAFDLILGSEYHSGPVFLECNPSGEFGFLDDALRGKPTHMIGRLLVSLALEGDERV